METILHANELTVYNITELVTTQENELVVNQRHGLAVLFIVIVILSLFGNLLLILAISTQPKLQRPGNIYIAGLAVTDILFTLCHVVSIDSKLGGYWQFSSTLCQITSGILQVTAILSVMHLMVIAFHRYLYICKHESLAKLFSLKVTVGIEVATWVFSLSIAIPGLVFTESEYDDRINTCVFASQAPGQWRYPAYLLAVLLLIPCPVCVCSYYKIYQYVKTMKQNLIKNDAMSRKDQSKLVQHQFQQLFSRLLVFLTFIVLYVPFLVTRILDSLVYVPAWVHLSCATMIALNPMLDPYIYGFLNKTFRDGYRQILVFRCCRKNAYRSR